MQAIRQEQHIFQSPHKYPGVLNAVFSIFNSHSLMIIGKQKRGRKAEGLKAECSFCNITPVANSDTQ